MIWRVVLFHLRRLRRRTHRNEVEQDYVASWLHDIEECKGKPLLALCLGIARVFAYADN